MTTFTIMCGLPRAGKSSWINKNKKDSIVISTDEIRKEIFGHQFHQPANKFVFAISEAMVTLLLKQNKSVIVDATHLTEALRMSWYPVIKKLDIQKQIVWVYADKDSFKSLEICKKRSKLSPIDERVPDASIENMSMSFEEPNLEYERIYDKIIEYHNK